MILVCDVGNTETTLGIYERAAETLRSQWRIMTDVPRTADEYGLLLRQLLIDDGINGRLFPVGDVDGMARAAIELLSDGEHYEAMAAAARHTAQQRYCASHIIPQYVDYYKRVLDAAP